MTVARQEMERDNLDYTSLEIIVTSLLAVLFTENIAYAIYNALLDQISWPKTFSLMLNYCGFSRFGC